MTALQKENSIYPFWNENVTLIKGFDPLGLQVTSKATYAKMLPGLSNDTNKLRYYGFYCWLIDFYFKKEKKGTQTKQLNFIRRAELLIALIMQKERKGITQISGSQFAANLINNTTTDFFDLAVSADIENENTYFKNPSGALGQYYLDSLQALALITQDKNIDGEIIFNITQPHTRQKVSGKQLAVAFDEGLTEEIKALFYNCINKAKLTYKDIPELINYFAIDKINPDSTEWKLYVDMLMDKDFPGKETEKEFTYHRRNTITALLSTAKKYNQEYNWLTYIFECYEQKLKNKNTDVGWYCYQLNEYWQIACGLIFYGTIQYLERYHSQEYSPNFIREFSILVNHESETLQNCISNINLNENDLLELIDNTFTPQTNVKTAFQLLYKLYANNKEQLPQLIEYMSRNGIKIEGNMAEDLIEFTKHLHDDVIDFTSFFIQNKILYRHQVVASQKMKFTTKTTNKLAEEEKMIPLNDIFPGQWTSPRMNTLQNLLSDLQIINEEGKITELHTKIQ